MAYHCSLPLHFHRLSSSLHCPLLLSFRYFTFGMGSLINTPSRVGTAGPIALSAIPVRGYALKETLISPPFLAVSLSKASSHCLIFLCGIAHPQDFNPVGTKEMINPVYSSLWWRPQGFNRIRLSLPAGLELPEPRGRLAADRWR